MSKIVKKLQKKGSHIILLNPQMVYEGDYLFNDFFHGNKLSKRQVYEVFCFCYSRLVGLNCCGGCRFCIFCIQLWYIQKLWKVFRHRRVIFAKEIACRGEVFCYKLNAIFTFLNEGNRY